MRFVQFEVNLTYTKSHWSGSKNQLFGVGLNLVGNHMWREQAGEMGGLGREPLRAPTSE